MTASELKGENAGGSARKESLQIFINYRREDASGHAGRLYDDLVDRFGDDDVFIDIDKIEPGLNFDDVIEHAIDRCDVVLAVIGKQWLTSADGSGRSRLEDPDDFVRLELEATLARGTRLIPLCVQGALMPVSAELPDSLRGLTRRQALELSDTRWRHDVESLTALLERLAADKEQELQERERVAAEQAERDRLAAEQAVEEQRAKEQVEQERLARVQAERERLAAERAERDRLAADQAEQERLAQERAERELAEEERRARERAERDQFEPVAEATALSAAAGDVHRPVADEAAEPEPASKDESERERAVPARSVFSSRLLLVSFVAAAVVSLAILLGIGYVLLSDDGPKAAAVAPTATSAPTISGTPRSGSTLTTTQGSWQGDPTAFRYQWQRCNEGGAACAAIDGATAKTYHLGAGDVGRRVRTIVTASSDAGTATSASRASAVVGAALVAPKNAALPTIEGTPQVGSTLSVDGGSWNGTKPIDRTYRWQRCNASGGACTTIGGARGRTYALQSADEGRTIRVVEIATNRAGRSSVPSRATSVVRARPTSSAPSTPSSPTTPSTPPPPTTTGPTDTVPPALPP